MELHRKFFDPQPQDWILGCIISRSGGQASQKIISRCHFNMTDGNINSYLCILSSKVQFGQVNYHLQLYEFLAGISE